MFVEFVITGVLAVVIYYLLQSNGKAPEYWSKHGVQVIDASVVASNLELLFGRKRIVDRDNYAYNKLGDGKFCGMLETPDPVILLKDIELIKKIMIKDFDHFVDRREFFPISEKNKLLNLAVSHVRGQEWKDLRNHITPAFTTGKMRRMMEFFNAVGKEWTDMLKQKCSQARTGAVEVNMTDCVNQFTVDVIGSAVFGIQTGVVQNPQVIFGEYARRLTEFGLWAFIKMNLSPRYPKLFSLLGIEVLDYEAIGFFEKILRQGLEARKKSEVKRHDFQELLLDVQKGRLHAESKDELSRFEKDAALKPSSTSLTLTDDMIVAQSIMFFFAGFSTTSNFVTFASYVMAARPDIQEKLQKDVDSISEDGKALDYDALGELKYLDMFVNEVNRYFPVAARLERMCTKEYHDPESGLFVPKNGVVFVPVTAIHHDPKHYPNPEVFDPENFSAEKKADRSPYAYLPFGIGPRNCLGNRFALIESKAAIAHLVRSFWIEPSESTPLPLQSRVIGIQTMPPKDLKLILRAR